MIGRASLSPRRLARSEGMSAFRHRNYRLFFSGQAISLVGTWMQQVAQAWLVLELTHDPIWLGIVAAAQFIPVMILGLFAGVAADALPKRRVLLWTQVSMMILAAILGVLVITDVVQVWMILVLATLLGIANAVDMPVRQSFAIELVGREDVGNAVALNSAMFNGARVIGPAAAGLAIAAFGVGPAFIINSLSFLAVIVGLRMMDEHELHTPPRIARPGSARAVVRNLAEGLGYVRQTQVVLLAVVVVGSVATVGMNFNVLIPAFAQNELGSGAAGFGFLMAASGVGSLLAALRLVVRRPAAAGPSRDGRAAPWRRVAGTRGLARFLGRAGADGRRRVRVDPDGRDRQHDDPVGRAGPSPRSRDERLHDGLQRVRADRRAGDGRGRLGLRVLVRDRARRRADGRHRPRRVRLGSGRRLRPHDGRRGRLGHVERDASGDRPPAVGLGGTAR